MHCRRDSGLRLRDRALDAAGHDRRPESPGTLPWCRSGLGSCRAASWLLSRRIGLVSRHPAARPAVQENFCRKRPDDLWSNPFQAFSVRAIGRHCRHSAIAPRRKAVRSGLPTFRLPCVPGCRQRDTRTVPQNVPRVWLPDGSCLREGGFLPPPPAPAVRAKQMAARLPLPASGPIVLKPAAPRPPPSPGFLSQPQEQIPAIRLQESSRFGRPSRATEPAWSRRGRAALPGCGSVKPVEKERSRPPRRRRHRPIANRSR